MFWKRRHERSGWGFRNDLVRKGDEPRERTPQNVLSFAPSGWFGPNTPQIRSLLTQAARLTRAEVAQLDRIEAADHEALMAAWEHLRDRLRNEPERRWRFDVREASWRAYKKAATRLGLPAPPDDGYWRVAQDAGFGAARATRFAACALVAPEKLDPDSLDDLLRPWRSIGRGLGP